MTTRILIGIAAALPALAAACTPAEPPRSAPAPAPSATVTAAPAIPSAPEKQAPPEGGPAREPALVTPAWAELGNGLRIATLETGASPLVQVRVVVLGGSSLDGDRPGVASITAELSKEGGAGGKSGREIVDRLESLGATLEIATSFDRTTLSLSAPKAEIAEAMGLVAAMVKRPALGPTDLVKLKKRRTEAAADRARSDGAWAASRVMHQLLFGGAADHPYARLDPAAAEIAKIGANDCRAFHKRVHVPKNMFVVVAGDVARDDARSMIERALGDMSGGEPPRAVIPELPAPPASSITLVDRPKSALCHVLAGVLVAERTSSAWPALATASHLLGGDVSGRLSTGGAALLTDAGAQITELARGPSVLVARAAVPSGKTGLGVQAVLAEIERLGSTEPAAAEVAAAARALADATTLRLETPGALADELARDRTLGLPDDAPLAFHRAVRAVTPAMVANEAREHLRASRAVVVVSGDAKLVGSLLRRFGDVRVVDPTSDLAVKETLSRDPEAPLELQEEAGK